VTLGDHSVPVIAARELTTVSARRRGAETGLTLLPLHVVLQLASALEPTDHPVVAFAALLHRLKVGETQFGYGLALSTLSTTKTAGTLSWT
jgi:hypothetical protein